MTSSDDGDNCGYFAMAGSMRSFPNFEAPKPAQIIDLFYFPHNHFAFQPISILNVFAFKIFPINGLPEPFERQNGLLVCISLANIESSTYKFERM
jgi:hypothetical protein